MPRLYVLVKRKNSKRWEVAIPARARVTRARLATVISKSRKPGYMYKIATESQVKSLLARKPVKRRMTGRKRQMRKPTTRKTRRRVTRRRKRT